MTIVEASNAFDAFAGGLTDVVRDVMDSHKGQIVEIIQEQLYSGVRGDDTPLRPTYLDDTWFNTEDAGHWKGRAKAYMLWKKEITPPVPSASWLGYPARSVSTPNLFITGKFHESLRAQMFDDKMVFTTEGTTFGDDVVQKYGIDILKVGQKGVNYIVQTWVRPRLESYFKKCGL
jgi:hypothetical protein